MATDNQINDLIFLALAAFTGETLNERLISWLKSEGATGSQLTDLWNSFFDVKVITGTTYNDRMVKWLLSEGATGDTFNDLQYSYWRTRVETP